MTEKLNLELELSKIENRFNEYVEKYNVCFYTTIFILKMNEFLSGFPKKVIKQYHWKRYGSHQKPSLYLQNINRIVKFHKKENKYKVIRPHNLDTFLTK